MRAFAVRSFGEAPAIHNLQIPAADGAFLISVRYAGSIRVTTNSSNN